MKKITTFFAFLMLVAFGATASSVDTLTIAGARLTQADGSPVDSGQIVQVTGVVYGPNSNKYPTTGSTFWLNDGTAGIKIYATHQFGYTVTDGDTITVQGYLSSYYGSAEIDLSDTASLDTIIFRSHGTPDTAVVINVAALSASTYGQLVQVNNVNMTAGTPWGSTTKAYFTCKAPILGGSTDVYIYVYEYTNSAMFHMAQPTGIYNVRGIGDYSLYNGEVDANIDPRDSADFIPVDTSTSTGINTIADRLTAIVYPNPASTQVIVGFGSDINQPVTSKMFDVTGREVLAITNDATEGFNEVSLNTSGLSNGLYVLDVRLGAKSMITKINIVK